MTFGHSDQCDIILTDDGIEPEHFSIRDTGGGVELIARTGTILLDSAKQLPEGYRARINRDTFLSAANVDFDIVVPQAPIKTPPRSRSIGAIPVLICAMLLASTNSTGRARLAPDLPEPQHSEQMDVPQIRNSENTPEPPIKADPVDVVYSKLEQVGLETLTLKYEAGAFIMSGDLPKEQAPTWRDFQHWFDASFPNMMLQTRNVRLRPDKAAHPPFPKVESVWGLGRPYAIIDGKRVYVGNSLPGGWTLASLKGGKIGLSFKGKTYWLSLLAETPDEN